MIKNFQKKIKFIELVTKMNDIERIIYLKDGRKENDAEHTFQLAVMSMLFVEDFHELDELKCIKMALVHDLVEIFAGDTPIFSNNGKNRVDNKKEREEQSLLKLEEVLGEESFSYFKDPIIEYEKRESKEARFVYQLDKLQPMIQTVLEGGRSWNEFKFGEEPLMSNKRSKITDEFGFDKILEHYYQIAKKGEMFYEE